MHRRRLFFSTATPVLFSTFYFLFSVSSVSAAANQSWDMPPGPVFDRTTMVKVSCVYYQKDIEAIIGLDDFGPLAFDGREILCYEPFNLYDALGRSLQPGTAVTLCLSDGRVTGLDCMATEDDSLVTTIFEGRAGVHPVSVQRRQQEQGVQQDISQLVKDAPTLLAPQTQSRLESIRWLINTNGISISPAAERQLAAVEQIKEKKQKRENTSVPPSSGSGTAFSRALRRGSRGDDVRLLQEFLSRDRAIYPEGLVTGYFGPLTEAAVQRFQAREDIVSSGDSASTGYGRVGPRTRARVNELW